MLPLLLSTIQNDDDRAFLLNLYTEYYALARNAISQVTHGGQDTDDLVEDTFLKLIEKISLLRALDCCKTAAYVVYTAKSIAINFIRHRDVCQKHGYYGGQKDISEEMADAEDPRGDTYLRMEEIEALSDAVLKLPERQKDLLHFKYTLDMSDSEIAEKLSISPDSVREYLTRARRAIKKLMEKEGD